MTEDETKILQGAAKILLDCVQQFEEGRPFNIDHAFTKSFLLNGEILARYVQDGQSPIKTIYNKAVRENQRVKPLERQR